jgi:hypothetical protein
MPPNVRSWQGVGVSTEARPAQVRARRATNRGEARGRSRRQGLGCCTTSAKGRPQCQAYSSYYAACFAEIEEAEALGYQTVWLSEQHLTPDGFLPSPPRGCAAVAARTSRIRIGTNILPLRLHHP